MNRAGLLDETFSILSVHGEKKTKVVWEVCWKKKFMVVKSLEIVSRDHIDRAENKVHDLHVADSC